MPKPKPKKQQVAERLYNEALKIIERYYTGDKTTYLTELEGVGRKLFGVKFKGVFPSDKIPQLNDLSPYCILNLDSSKQQGSHWVALVKFGNDSIFYDSFGRHDSQIIKNLRYSGNGRIINTQDDAEQKIYESNCGARCLGWIYIYDKYGRDIAMLI